MVTERHEGEHGRLPVRMGRGEGRGHLAETWRSRSMMRPQRFQTPLAMLRADPDHSVGEQRYLVLGMSNQRRLLVAAFAERPPRTRLISARRATGKERRQYEEEG